MKKLNIFGIIIAVIIFTGIIGGAMFKSYNKKLQVKANLKEDTQQLSKKITEEETKVSNLKELHNQSDRDTFQSAIDSAKEVFKNPNHTSMEVYNSTTELSLADSIYEGTTLTEMATPPTDTTDTSTVNNDEAIWQYCVDRWAYYDKINGSYSSDKYDTEVFGDCSSQYGITPSEAQATWDKVDKVKMGITN